MRRLASPLRALSVAAAIAAFAAAPAAGSIIVHFQRESLAALEGQLRAGSVHAVTFHPNTDEIHASLNAGQRMTVRYPAAEEASLVSRMRAKGIPVKFAKATAKPKPVHHKLRYIVGGALIVVILVVLGVLLLGRRRELAEEGGPVAPDASGSAPADAP